ncbi:MAG: FUSC family protein [Desulfuromonadales bacterium]
MNSFADKAKEPFKTALAMVIAYGIALAMDWGNPYWAGFAVAFVSLATVGQSFNKAAMRMFGTLVAVVVALLLIGLFPQERWLFMLFLSTYVGFCTYLMAGPKQQYFWNVSGFVCILICMSAGPDPVNAFDTAVLRAEETGLGILVYSLIAMLLWPVSSRRNFFATVSQIASVQRHFCRAGLNRSVEGDPVQVPALKGQLLQAQTQLQQLLLAAESDTREVFEMRRYWQHYKEQATRLTETIDRCHQGLAELEASNTPHLLTNLDFFLDELDARFAAIEKILAGEKPEQDPNEIELVLDMTGLQALSHFQRAAVVVLQERMEQLDQLTRALFETVSVVSGFAEPAKATIPRTTIPTLQWPDPDRMLAVIRVMLTMWLAYLALIYVDSIPGGNSFVTMAGVFGMIMASLPMVSIRTIFVPLMASVVFGCLIYVFILPHLSGFLSLGSLLFIVTFAICYLFSSPKQQLGRTFALAMFVSIASIDNQQVYSFMVVATNMLMFPLLFLFLAVTAYFPVNLRTEKSFLRLHERYFRSCSELLSGMQRDVQQTERGYARLRKAFQLREISSIPAKLAPWAKFLDIKALPGTEAQDVQALLPKLQDLTGRMKELVEVRSVLRNQYLISELGEEAVSWRHNLLEAFKSLESAPTDITQKHETYRKRLDGLIDRLETRIRETLDRATGEQFGKEDGEHFYRLLGVYRGVTEALVGYTATAGAIDWGPWHEERF